MILHTKTLEKKYTIEKYLKDKTLLPFSLIKKLLRKKTIKVDGKNVKEGFELSDNQTIEVRAKIDVQQRISSPSSKKETAEYKKLTSLLKNRIILQDENIIAFDKPSGVAVQGGTKIKISIDDVLDEFKFDYNFRPKLVHRLDKDTSGVLIIARTSKAAEILAKKFKEKEISKYYLALLHGTPKPKQGTVKIKLAKKLIGQQEVVTVTDEGKIAITKYNVLENFANKFCLIEYQPETGRTHQLRVTSQYLGHPIVGDRKYKTEQYKTSPTKQLCLHCQKMEFEIDGENYTLEAKAPNHLTLE